MVTTDILQNGAAIALLMALHDRGLRVTVAAGRLVITPASRLTQAERAAIVQHRHDLAALVRICDAGVQDRRDMFARQLAEAPTPRFPAFLYRQGVPYVEGICFSCGDRLPDPRFGRCWRCGLAWRLAARVPINDTVATAHAEAKLSA
jgi:hypothetical protein